MPAQLKDDLDLLMGKLGEFGKYQCIQFLLHLLAALTAGVHMLSLVTVAAVPEHRCAIPDLADGTAMWNATEVHRWIPQTAQGVFDSCTIRNPLTNVTSLCDQWVFSDMYYKTSRAIEWEFVCAQRWKGAVSQSAYMFGVFFGAVTLGSLADSYGRKTIFYISAILQLFFGVSVAFVTNFYVFLVNSFFYGMFGSAGSYITAFVLSMELVGPTKRTICGITFQATFAVGIMLVAFWGYLISNYVTLQMVYGLHSLLLIGHWWLMDESPRWLWSRGKISQSVDIVAKAVKMNTGETIEKSYFISRGKAKSHQSKLETAGLRDMFRKPFMRKKTLNLSLNWFANSLAYYSLSLNVGVLEGNPFLILFVMGLIEIPGYLLTMYLLDKTGRRCSICSFMIIGATACLITAVLPSDWSFFATCVVFAGKFCIACSFAIIYNYSAEIFPTVLRNTGLGFGSMCARFSATLTPLITLLDSFDKRVPTVVFASVTLLSGFLTMFLPETLGQPMPQSLQDGETFGKGDTVFTTGCLPMFKKSKSDDEVEIKLNAQP
ncbi:organic cation transporter protein [Cimex lectularius]|uniref:Major facilitator superfamily (MFS) profile domain-containing protein n=1 Tax=Cimex lectularius TaxID=79782 RepID=A0A8I6RW60_CIMLE|nr:organic cation transporter protein [Cimex lectularius]